MPLIHYILLAAESVLLDKIVQLVVAIHLRKVILIPIRNLLIALLPVLCYVSQVLLSIYSLITDYFGNRTTEEKKQPVDSKTCDLYFTLVRQGGKIAEIVRIMLLQSGCINQILSNPMIFLGMVLMILAWLLRMNYFLHALANYSIHNKSYLLGGGDIGDIFDEIMDLIGFGKDDDSDDIWEGAAIGPLDLGN